MATEPAVTQPVQSRAQPRQGARPPDWAEPLAGWLMVGGAVLLVLSLFLTWSHQISPALRVTFGSSDLLRGVPADPTAWQVYSAADVFLALLAAGLVVVAMIGSHLIRQLVAAGCLVAFAFTVHALSAPPSNGVNLFNPALAVPNYVPNSPAAGVGETVAILALLLAFAGLAVSFLADRAASTRR